MAIAVANVETNQTTDVFSSPETARRNAKPDVLERAIAATHSEAVQSKGLSRNQKAAIIVRLLQGSDGLSLARLDAPALTRLVHGMAGLSYVNEATVLRVIQDFLAEIDSLALYFQPGLQGAIDHLGSELPDEIVASMKTTPPPVLPDDPWSTITVMEASDILALLAEETPQVVAIVLSKIPPVKAAEILGELSAEKASSAAQAAIGMGKVGEKAVSDIGDTIMRQFMDKSTAGALSGSPVERVGAMLNFAAGATRNTLLQDIESLDQETGEQIRLIMFTFADIPDRVEIKDIPKVVRAVENDILVTALAGAIVSEKDSAEFLLTNLSKRLSEQLEEEVKEVGEVNQKDADNAMNVVIQAIRDLEDSGEITLVSPRE